MFCLLSKGETQSVQLSSEDTSAILQCFQEFREALANEEYEKAWNLTSNIYRKELHEDNFEIFKKGLLGNPKTMSMLKENLMIKEAKIIPITVDKVIVEMPPIIFGNYYIRENGVWKFNGRIKAYVDKVKRDMINLSALIEKYYRDKGVVPKELSQLTPVYIKKIPPDLFNDKSEPYIYTSTENTWELYSFGPDADDDFGLTEYDLQKGPLSDGDIVIRGLIKGK